MRLPGGLDIQNARNNQLDLLKSVGDSVGDLVNCLEQLQLFLKLQQSIAVSTLDTIVFEHERRELPATQAYYSLALEPQTRQMEQIDAIFCAITYPALPGANPITAPTITLDNAYARLGGVDINLNAIVNSSGGSGGAVPVPLGILLDEGSTRTFNFHATANFPVGAYLSCALIGRTIPATLGEANV